MNNLKKLRNELNLTVRELSKYVDISIAAISYLENGERPFRQVHIEKLTSFFRVTSDYLLGKSTNGYVVYEENGLDEVILSENEYYDYKLNISNIICDVSNSSGFSMNAYVDENGNLKYYEQYNEGIKYIVQRKLNIPYKEKVTSILSVQLHKQIEELTEEQKEKVIKFIKDYIV